MGGFQNYLAYGLTFVDVGALATISVCFYVLLMRDYSVAPGAHKIMLGAIVLFAAVVASQRLGWEPLIWETSGYRMLLDVAIASRAVMQVVSRKNYLTLASTLHRKLENNTHRESKKVSHIRHAQTH